MTELQRKHIPAIVFIVLFGFIVDLVPVCGLEKLKIPLMDSLDGAVDLSYFLASVNGFLPFAIPVTEPAVGYGVAGGPIFIHRDLEALKRGDPVPPSLSFIGGLNTGNGTWGVGGGHSGVWKNDRIRYVGAAM